MRIICQRTLQKRPAKAKALNWLMLLLLQGASLFELFMFLTCYFIIQVISLLIDTNIITFSRIPLHFVGCSENTILYLAIQNNDCRGYIFFLSHKTYFFVSLLLHYHLLAIHDVDARLYTHHVVYTLTVQVVHSGAA